MAESFLEWVADSCTLRTALRVEHEDGSTELIALDAPAVDAPGHYEGDREILNVDVPEDRARLIDLWLGVDRNEERQ